MKLERLDNNQLRAVADALYGGEYKVAPLMQQIRMFKRGDEILLWLVRNKLSGKKMVDFFKDAANCESNRGVLLGVEQAIKYIDGHASLKSDKLFKDSLI